MCQNHHVVPRSKGGTKTIPLCEKCHGIVHGLDMTNHGNLIRSGLVEAKRKGRVLGRSPKLDDDFLAERADIVEALQSGLSIRVIAGAHGCGISTVQKVKTILTRKP
jgi:hypothetical protein